MQKFLKMWQPLLCACALVVIGMILYLSWQPQPQLSAIGLLPAWLTDWTDASAHDNIRTGIPFVFLGLVTGILLLGSRLTWRVWPIAWLALVALALIAETGQLLLPSRSFDSRDILWGACGALAGQLIAALLNRAWK